MAHQGQRIAIPRGLQLACMKSELLEGIGIIEILNAIVARIPPPEDTSKKPFRALIFDSLIVKFKDLISMSRAHLFCCCVLSLMQVQRPLLYASSCYTIALSTEALYGSAIAAMVCLYGRILSFTIFCDPPLITLSLQEFIFEDQQIGLGLI
ncbi:Translation factor GUF1, chloroplastic [Glycine max]|nr:Translation factor GUF1, chloroplastic [Glycine max]